jgi:hypothetical protein
MNRRSKTSLGARCAAAFAVVAMAAALTAGDATAGVGQKCHGTFRVQHNDKIDGVSFPAGRYTISVKRMACQQASDYFKQFLQNNQNDLPKSWRLFADRLKFKNKKQNIAFRVKHVGGGGGGGGSMTGKCPGTFQVLNDDRINNLSVPAGKYVIKVKRMACRQASDYFKQFLAANEVSKGWRVIKPKKKFRNKKQNIAFRISPA